MGLDRLREWRHAWTELEIAFYKSPANIDLSESGIDPQTITSERTLYQGPVRAIARLFPRNVNTVVTCALATIGLDRCQARMVYWAPNPDSIPHGRLQRWFYEFDPDNKDIADARAARAQLLAAPIPEVNGEPVIRDPESWTAALADLAKTSDFEMWGVTAMQPGWVYEGQSVAQKNIIVIGVAHQYAAIATAPEATAGAEVVRQYGRAAAADQPRTGRLVSIVRRLDGCTVCADRTTRVRHR